MGLLDNLQLGHGANFGGGLLDFLRTTQMQNQQYQPSQGFSNPMDANAQMQAAPMKVGNYQMPRIGTEQSFTPDPAAIPQNAQPTQGQMPMQAPQQPQGPGFGDRLMAGFQNFANAGGPLQALAGGISGLATGSAPGNQTAQFLVSKGIDPALAKTIVSDPVMLRSVLPSLMGTGGQTDDIKEYQFARREDPTLTFNKFMQQKKAVSGEYSLTPQYGTDKDGNTVLIQTGKSGEAIQTKLPAGVKISSGVEKMDLGTEWGLIDRRTGQLIGKQAKDIKGKEKAEEIGKAEGVATAALPAVEITANRTLEQIDQFMNSKGFNEVFGVMDQYRPNFTMSDSGRDALAKFKQLSGRAFLEGRSMLKGGGAITDFESNKAESAIARLDRSQSEADARAALQEFKEAVREGAAKLRATAGGGAAPAAPAPGATPNVDDLLKKYGGK